MCEGLHLNMRGGDTGDLGHGGEFGIALVGRGMEVAVVGGTVGIKWNTPSM